MEPVNPQDWYWTLEKWVDDILPVNADKIIRIANRLIDEFAVSNPNTTQDEMTNFCNSLWAEYSWCRWIPSAPHVNRFLKSDYQTLLEKALSTDAQQIDIDTLGEWLECWGGDQKRGGGCFSLGGGRFLCPIYSRWPDKHNSYSLLRYEIRTAD